MSEHIARAYNRFEITDWGTIYKRSDTDRLRNERDYYKLIDYSSLKSFFPRLYTSSDTHLELEYYAYNNIGNMLMGAGSDRWFDHPLWHDTVDLILRFLKRASYVMQGDPDMDDMAKMYIEKTWKYFNEFEETHPHLTCPETLTINGITHQNFPELWDNGLKKRIREICQNAEQFNVIHGDFCLSNMLMGINPVSEKPVLKLIDPRGSFGKQSVIGDPRYDLAKLSHSLNGGYEWIISNRFVLETEEFNGTPMEYKLRLQQPSARPQAAKLFDFSKDVRIIEGLIWIGMCSRHYDSSDRQTAMYLTGVKTLNENLY